MRKIRVFFTFLLLFLFTTSGAWASSDDHLLDLLIRKGVITREEGTSLKKEAEKETDSAPAVLPKALQGLKVGMLGYIDYSAGETGTALGGGDSYNRFTVTRGYLTVEKAILPWMGARMTSDVHQDSAGDWKFRLKYLFAELRPDDLGPLTNMKAEIGQGHIPWLDFEEHVNPYRAQGTMAIERAGIFNSADMGLSLRGNFDGKLEDAAALTGNGHYDGRYGSWHLGVYDGGGYHASEKNNNKVAEGRLTVRPLPASLPGLQLSYLGIYGDGNTAAGPDYRVNLGMISYEHPRAILTAQYFTTKGNASGSLVDSTGKSLDTKGYSLFGRVKLPVMEEKLAVFGRYDHFDPDDDGVISSKAAYDLSLGGLSYELYKGNMVLLTYERTNHEDDSNGLGVVPVVGTKLGDDHRVQVVYQLKF
jgi:hypothetical protein